MANKAAWLPAEKAKPLIVGEAPMPMPKPDEVVIRNRAVAINPTDWALQAISHIPVSYPFIAGCDAAGEISAVGSDVEYVKVGDRVVVFLEPYGSQDTAHGAFQLFSVAKETAVAKLPDNISYTDASVFPLALSTAATALFQKDTLALPYPKLSPEAQGKVIFVWGGSTSVGTCGIQLLIAAGFDVAVAASGHNLEYLKTLGAKYVFDYRKDNIEEDVIHVLDGLDFGGAFCAWQDSDALKKCGQIASKLGGNKFLATIYAPMFPPADGLVPSDVKISTGKFRVW